MHGAVFLPCGSARKLFFGKSAQLAAQRGDLVGDRDNESLLSAAEGVDALGGFFDQAFSAQDFEQLFRAPGAAERPETRPFTAGDNHAETICSALNFLVG